MIGMMGLLVRVKQFVTLIYPHIVNKCIETNDKEGHFIFKYDWIREENGGLEFVNKTIINKQKGIITYILR